MEDQLNNMDTIDMEVLVTLAEEKGKLFKESRIKTNQIRNFYSEITAMKLMMEQMPKEKEKRNYADLERKLLLLKPKLAYAAGRNRDVRVMYAFVDKAIGGVQKADDKGKAFQNFFDLIESVVAYHKFYGGD